MREKLIPSVKASKDKLTLSLGASAADDFKLKPKLIYHSENLRIFRNYAHSTMPVPYKGNKKAWMIVCLFTTWFTESFKLTVETYCSE